jgi:glycerol transport system ATP-binding protein
VALELQGITKIVDGTQHLFDISLSLNAGSFNTFLGPTLSGKTSLLRIMAGLDQPTFGSISVNGVDVTGVSAQKRDVAFVYQQFINYPSLSVFENIAAPLKVRGLNRAEIADRVDEMAELLSLKPMLQRRPSELSGGQQQRVALARALARRAELVLLDEPLANLDYKLREELRAELPEFFKASGSIAVYATTEPEEALLLGGHVATLQEGRLLQAGETKYVYRSPVSLQAAQTFSDPPLNIINAQNRAGIFTLALLESNLTTSELGVAGSMKDGDYSICIRPHHLSFDKKTPTALALKGRVAVTELTGSDSYIHFDVQGERWTALLHGMHSFDVGAEITFFADLKDFLIFGPDGLLVFAEQHSASREVV